MKKYILTESQVKGVVDKLIQEQLFKNRIKVSDPLIATVQCFLNLETRAGLKVDGINGPKTTNALMAFQEKKGAQPDGIWGYSTQHKLNPSEEKTWSVCLKRYRTT